MSAPTVNKPAKNSVLVPIGGPGWGWGLWARYGFIASIEFFFWAVPIPYLAGWHSWLWAQGSTFLMGALAPIEMEYVHVVYRWFGPIVPALIWLLLDRKRKYDAVIMEAARVMARLGLAFVLSAYGYEKIIAAQGSSAYATERMLRAFGESGGQTTLMAWLGHSTIYEWFAGWVESGAAILLVFRRTATLGAILALAALVNVFIVNTGHWDLGLGFTPFAFMHIPVFLLAPEVERLVGAFSGKGTGPLVHRFLTPPKWLTYAGNLGKALMVMWLYLGNAYTMHAVHLAVGYRSPLRGIYTVERFTRNGGEEPLAYQYPKRWREVAISSFDGGLTVQTADGDEFELGPQWNPPPKDAQPKDPVQAVDDQLEAAKKPDGDWIYGSYSTERIVMGPVDTRKDPGSLHYHRPTQDDITLTGKIDNDSLEITLRRIALDTLPFYRYRWYVSEWRNSWSRQLRRWGWTYR